MRMWNDTVEQHDAAQSQPALTSETLSALPVEWLAQLQDAATRARGDLVLDLLTTDRRGTHVDSDGAGANGR